MRACGTGISGGNGPCKDRLTLRPVFHAQAAEANAKTPGKPLLTPAPPPLYFEGGKQVQPRLSLHLLGGKVSGRTLTYLATRGKASSRGAALWHLRLCKKKAGHP